MFRKDAGTPRRAQGPRGGRRDLEEGAGTLRRAMRVARGSASWLSSHGRGLGPQDALKKDS